MKQDNQKNNDLPNIGAPATRALTIAGYTNLNQLTKISETELGQLHGVGPKALSLLREALNAQGLSFCESKRSKPRTK